MDAFWIMGAPSEQNTPAPMRMNWETVWVDRTDGHTQAREDHDPEKAPGRTRTPQTAPGQARGASGLARPRRHHHDQTSQAEDHDHPTTRRHPPRRSCMAMDAAISVHENSMR